MFKLNRGLMLPLTGSPKSELIDKRNINCVALTGYDFLGMKPSMFVKEGDFVLQGQKLFECKKIPGINFTSPVTGRIKSIIRGEKRVFQTVIIERENGNRDRVEFKSFKKDFDYNREEIVSFLNEAGVFNSFRTRPFSKTPKLDSIPSSIFVTAMDTNPLSISSEWIIKKKLSQFEKGLEVLKLLTDKVFVCAHRGSMLKNIKINEEDNSKVSVHEFDGPHPAGNAGTHIHFLDPIFGEKVVWHIGYQDLIAIGSLVLSGKLYTDRYITIGGPKCQRPQNVLTITGADINKLVGEVSVDTRVISGSVFNGRKIDDVFHFLGKFHNQITMLEECTEREFMGWHQPGFDKFSVMNLFISKLNPFAKFKFNTSSHGSQRAIVPVGQFEKVMPLDILATQLLKSLMVKDTDTALELGALELDEEDLALCTFVCHGKNNYQKALRQNLDIIEKEG